jgi:hypothetical protein
MMDQSFRSNALPIDFSPMTEWATRALQAGAAGTPSPAGRKLRTRDTHIRWFELEPFGIGNGDFYPSRVVFGALVDGRLDQAQAFNVTE